MHAAHLQNHISPGQVHGIGHGRVDTVASGWRAGDNARDPGDLGRGDAHQRRSGMGIPPARHVTARALHGNDALPQRHTGLGLNFKRSEAVFLGSGKTGNLSMRKINIVFYRLRHLSD